MPSPGQVQKRDANSREIEQADQQYVVPDDLNTSTTFTQGEWVAIWTADATRSTHYAPGYGVRPRELAEGFSDMDLQDSGNNAVSGKLRFAIYASSNRDDLLYKVGLPKPAVLRDAQGSNRTEKPIVHQRAPAASNDRQMAMECKVDNSTNDGNTPSGSTNSTADLGIAYSEL